MERSDSANSINANRGRVLIIGERSGGKGKAEVGGLRSEVGREGHRAEVGGRKGKGRLLIVNGIAPAFAKAMARQSTLVRRLENR